MAGDQRDVRTFLLDELKKDLVGPHSVDEEISDPPTQYYLTNILYPAGTPQAQSEDDEANEAAISDDEIDLGARMASTFRPSAFGMTFTVECGEQIAVSTTAAIYLEAKQDAKSKKTVWKRRALDLPEQILLIDAPGSNEYELATGLALMLRVRRRGEQRVVTLSMINRHDAGPLAQGSKVDPLCFFQPKIKVRSVDADNQVFIARSSGASGSSNEKLTTRLLYRHSVEYAVGHGCGVSWVADEGQNAVALETEPIPAYEVPHIAPSGGSDPTVLGMQFLAEHEKDTVVERLESFVGAYKGWIDLQTAQVPHLPDELMPPAQSNLGGCVEAYSRMKDCVDLLAEVDSSVWEAFRLANLAMLSQREARLRADHEEANAGEDKNKKIPAWRPFQLAFLLLTIPTIVDPASEFRDVVDLLWFPTGGGKTEAYLGLVAFTIFYRRLISGGEPEGAGVSAIMRYTLRLLTIQQFQRAATLIMASELIRRENATTLGKEEIRLGLWVGGGATPNTLKEAKKALKRLLDGEQLYEKNPYQVLSCPWCGQRLTPRDYKVELEVRMWIYCPNPDCEFGKGLPLYLVDEDVYRFQPSLLIGTVDKFARLPWVASTSNLFGRTGTKRLPPSLIIQDELHLISGPLGTLVGSYETAIDALCTINGTAPKVIASTATIRRASEQVKGVFNRGLRQFPPPGLDARDSYYALEQPLSETPGRLFVGVHAPGRSGKTALLRIYAVLLEKIHAHRSAADLRDPYWTLVGYFNSLRELGGARRLVDDDVRARMKHLAERDGEKLRKTDAVRELTSRVGSFEIPEILELMAETLGEPDALDVLLATNMISVGVDIDRLGLMVVNGQPKTTSEYIQATSRVGRVHPGLIVTLYNQSRPRDRSHYERFVSYHSSLYSQVEGASVTPFSSRARDRALHGVYISLVRHLSSDLLPETAAGGFDPDGVVENRAREIILARVEQLDPSEVPETERQLDEIATRWRLLAKADPLLYGEDFSNRDAPHLMESAERETIDERGVFPTLNSLRAVEGESPLKLLSPNRLGHE